ncbi:serine/threonine protein kinase [Sorangium cellulosum]|uniref:serine/threonine protein kinase n=1 Tax=Sorangium cellulosum TaxID=56 RepID=UPI001650E3A9|nr:protein kinase [Sorangium cellulosum]
MNIHQLAGCIVNQFMVIERIGDGARSAVYLARHSVLQHRYVVLKWRCEGSGNGHSADLEREAMMAHLCRHPNVVEIYDVAAYGDSRFVVMEHVDGRPLRDVMRSGQMSTDDVAKCAYHIAAGLSAMHSSGVVHRRISSDNIIVAQDGAVKIVDFGSAELVRMPEGASPYREDDVVDPRSDVAALGQLIVELLDACPDKTTLRHKKMREIASTCMSPVSSSCSVVAASLRPHAQTSSRVRLRTISLVAACLFASAFAAMVLLNPWQSASQEYEVADGRYASGCAVDGGATLKASAYMPLPSTIRFYISRFDDGPWPEAGTLTLFVGDGPSCSKRPFNIAKGAAEVVVGDNTQTIDLRVEPYDGKWSVGEEKRFWIGLSGEGWLSHRTTGPIFIKRVGGGS